MNIGERSMTHCEVETTIFGSVAPFATDATGYQLLSSELGEGYDRIKAWKMAIDQLLDWRKDTSQLMDEEMSPPTPDIIDIACALASRLRDEGQPGPLCVVPDGEGGVVFERRDGSRFQTISVEADGRVELISFENSRLTERHVISLAAEVVSSYETHDDVEGSALLSRDIYLETAA